MRNEIRIQGYHLVSLVIAVSVVLLIQYASGYGTDQPDVFGHSIEEIEIPDDFPLVPSGAVMAFAMDSCPTGWLEADGQQSLSSTDYPELYAAIGTTYGGSGGNFNLPDYRGYFMRGWDHGSGVDPDAESRTGGDTVGSVQEDEFESHAHQQVGRPALFLNSGGQGGYGIGSSTTLYDTRTTGGSSETRPKNIYVLYCIKY